MDFREVDRGCGFSNEVREFTMAKINIKTWRRMLCSWERLYNVE